MWHSTRLVWCVRNRGRASAACTLGTESSILVDGSNLWAFQVLREGFQADDSGTVKLALIATDDASTKEKEEPASDDIS